MEPELLGKVVYNLSSTTRRHFLFSGINKTIVILVPNLIFIWNMFCPQGERQIVRMRRERFLVRKELEQVL